MRIGGAGPIIVYFGSGYDSDTIIAVGCDSPTKFIDTATRLRILLYNFDKLHLAFN